MASEKLPGPALSEADMIPCDICGKRFATQQGVSMHKTRSHKPGRAKWARNGPLTEAVVVKEARPVDQGPSVVLQAETELFTEEPADADAFLDAIEDMTYQRAVAQFLPHLAREAERRGEGTTLMPVFLTLFLDVS